MGLWPLKTHEELLKIGKLKRRFRPLMGLWPLKVDDNQRRSSFICCFRPLMGLWPLKYLKRYCVDEAEGFRPLMGLWPLKGGE